MDQRDATPALEENRETDEVVVLRLNHGDAHNALTLELMAALQERIRHHDADPEIRAIVIGGTDKVFATGAELAALNSSRSIPETLAATRDFWDSLAACETPLLAGVSGFALGAGFELALACDLIVASESSVFGQPEITFGLIPGGGATQRLTRVIGKQRTMELVLTGRRIDADEALAMGLVNKIAGKRQWLVETIALAEVVARRPPIAVRLAKQAVLAADQESLEEGIEHERRLQLEAFHTEDRVEAGQALLDARRPQFEGK